MWNAIAALTGAAAVVVTLIGLILELRKARRDREEAQVGRVSAWLVPVPGQGRDLVIRNDSDAPIFAVCTAENALEPFKPLVDFLPPHRRETIRGFLPVASGNGRQAYPIVFIDAAGAHWTWWGADGIPADPSGKGFDGAMFERRR